MQRAIGGSLLGLGAYGAGTSAGLIGEGAMLSTPQGQAIAAALAIASLFD